jgi:hypothetical protein
MPRAGAAHLSLAPPAVLSDGWLVLIRSFTTSAAATSESKNGFLLARTSRDGGESFESESKIATFTSGDAGHSNVPSLAVDPNHGDRLYATWLDVDSAGNYGVYLSRSADRGSTWSKATLLSEQPDARQRETPAGKTYDAFIPSVAVNDEGAVGVAWYDTRVEPGGKPGWEYRFRASLDGGDTWLPSIRVSEQRTTLDRRATGHTSGLAAASHGAFHLLWIDGRTGQQQAWTSRVTVNQPRR